MLKFLPSFVGSKSFWVPRLKELGVERKPFVEFFAGSAVLTANLASNSILVDSDPVLCKILRRFDELIVPHVFTAEDYFAQRGGDNWWKFAYCLQRMSFSGVFRYSGRGYNVPIKKGIQPIEIRASYLEALDAWRRINPVIVHDDYLNLPLSLCRHRIAVFDPPYQGSKASYNGDMDYERYWQQVNEATKVADAVIIFDKAENLLSHNLPVMGVRSMRVTGHYAGDVEAMGLFRNGVWEMPEEPVVIDIAESELDSEPPGIQQEPHEEKPEPEHLKELRCSGCDSTFHVPKRKGRYPQTCSECHS